MLHNIFKKKKIQTNFLSKGGRLTLLNLSSLSTYYLSLFTIPKSMADRLEQFQRISFEVLQRRSLNTPWWIWTRFVHLLWWVDWGLGELFILIKHCQENDHGVLGTDTSHLWKHVIATKYGEDCEGWSTKASKGTHSHQALCEAKIAHQGRKSDLTESRGWPQHP